MRVSRLRFFNYLPNRKLLLRPRTKNAQPMLGDRRRKRLAQVATLLSGGHLATVAPLRDDEDGSNPREKHRGSQNAIQAQEHCRSPNSRGWVARPDEG